MPVYEHAESGVIIVDKPPDITSAKVVAVLKKLFRAKKMGHAGTLDPFATGVMVCCMNKATKLAGFFLKDEKTYVARLRLGIETDTQDLTGNIVSGVTAVDLPENRINAVCRQFEGALEQVPPVFSALKHKGVRLYKLARSGKPFQKPARRIYISYIKVLDINLPDVRLEISCSAGTYIRTLCADIGTALGCGGHLRELRRIQSSGFLITEASPLTELEDLSAAGQLSTRRIGMAAALRRMPVVVADDRLAEKIQQGKILAPKDLRSKPVDTLGGFTKIVDKDNNLLSVVDIQSENTSIKYCCVFS
jgi:tRNA pseudouridine55 synthase